MKPLKYHELSADPLASVDFSDQKLERHTRNCHSKTGNMYKTENGFRVRVYMIPKK